MLPRTISRQDSTNESPTTSSLSGVAPLIQSRVGILRGYTRGEVETTLSRGAPFGCLIKHDLCTPALILDLDRFEANLTKMASFVGDHGMNLRPHAKSHKCPAIAHRQIEAGAVGLSVATLHEAEVMAEAGVPGLLITSELVGEPKIERLLRLTKRHPETMVVVDNSANVRQLGHAAEANKQRLNVLIEVDMGNHKTGAAPGRPALELAQVISRTPGLRFMGLQTYAGLACHVIGFDKRKAYAEEVLAQSHETQELMRKSGIEVKLVSGGGTGSYDIESELHIINELQAGSYIFMDLDYRRIGNRTGELFDDFACALTVLTTVISRPYPGKAAIDAGFKAFATDMPFGPECSTVRGIAYTWGGDEHGKLNLAEAEREVSLGERLEFIIPHCDPTVNLYDCLYATRGENVEAVWPIAARGHLPYLG